MNAAWEALRLYNDDRQCLLALGMDKDKSVLRELNETELWCRNVSKARHLGTNEPDPWYWSIGIHAGDDESQEKWKMEMHRVKWFRDQATIDRWTEEKEVLEAEYVRVVSAHSRIEEIWNTMGNEYNNLSQAMKGSDSLALRHKSVLLAERHGKRGSALIKGSALSQTAPKLMKSIQEVLLRTKRSSALV
ncbi:hypothetical protein PQX77_019864 [Marasmius sp. AFHP31]|nr:hypothetical protein PQX77_019864 [Marasmius sp. AFHP31]